MVETEGGLNTCSLELERRRHCGPGNGKDIAGGAGPSQWVSQAGTLYACALCIWQLEALGLEKHESETKSLQSPRQIHFIRAEIKCIFDLFKFWDRVSSRKQVWLKFNLLWTIFQIVELAVQSTDVGQQQQMMSELRWQDGSSSFAYQMINVK